MNNFINTNSPENNEKFSSLHIDTQYQSSTHNVHNFKVTVSTDQSLVITPYQEICTQVLNINEIETEQVSHIFLKRLHVHMSCSKCAAAR